MKAFLTLRFALSQLTLLILFFIFSLFLPFPSTAKLSGECYKCHTMHDSQNGTVVAKGWNTGDARIGWDGNTISGGRNEGPRQHLLVSSCVGCHSSNTSETIHDPGGLNIPIVFNINGYPSQPLAGGNFYWVSQRTADLKYNAYGHNVYGIAGPDVLTQAPGKMVGCASGSCHNTLATAPTAPDSGNYGRGGCQGCHVYTSHHKNRGWYRFLKGHDGVNPFDPGTENVGDYVIGKGDTDWEQTKSSSDHNWYKGVGNDYPYYSDGEGLLTYQTITSFCSGCHSKFHNQNQIDGMSYTSPWKRHPTDILLPTTGEYSAYKPWDSGKYSVEAPVAWLNPLNPQAGQAVVMCLSCHRPHGSDQPDLLRWDYATMIAGDDTKSGGCFTCHTTKNDAP